MTLCPHCQSSNIRYRYYRSSSWVSTWRCDICKDELYEGHNFYHCRSCCDRGGSSHEPEVKRCSGMYCTYCVNKKNNDWQQEKKRLQDAKDESDRKAAKAQKALDDEKTRQNEVKAEKKRTAKATLAKSNTFCNKCSDKIAQIKSSTSESSTKTKADIPTDDELTQISNQFTKLIQQNNADLASIQNTTKGLITEAATIENYETEKDMKAMIDQITEQQELITVHKQKVRKEIKEVNKQQIDIIEQETAVNNAIIETKKQETGLHGVDAEIDVLRKEIQGLSGKEINSNPDAVKIMNAAYEKLLEFLQEKHTENKQRYAELKKIKSNITNVRAKLMSVESNNKYLLQCLSQQYDCLSNIAQDIANKFTRRSLYFLSVTVGLKQNDMQLFEDYGILDDMDGIMELTEDELIDIGVEKKGIRNKILRKIKELKVRIKDNQN